MSDRSNRRETRNPVLGLPSAKRLAGMPEPHRSALRALLRDLQIDARERSASCWKRHKAPMALYWKAVSVYAGHIARVLA